MKQRDPKLKQERVVFTCHFSSNSFFTNSSLSAALLYDDGEIIKSQGTKIEWLSNPTVQVVEKKQVHKRTKKVRMKREEIQMKSFFEIFSDYSIEEDAVMADESDAELNIFALDDLINEIMEILPYSLEFYLNTVPDQEFDDKTEDDSVEEEEEY